MVICPPPSPATHLATYTNHNTQSLFVPAGYSIYTYMLVHFLVRVWTVKKHNGMNVGRHCSTYIVVNIYTSNVSSTKLNIWRCPCSFHRVQWNTLKIQIIIASMKMPWRSVTVNKGMHWKPTNGGQTLLNRAFVTVIFQCMDNTILSFFPYLRPSNSNWQQRTESREANFSIFAILCFLIRFWCNSYHGLIKLIKLSMHLKNNWKRKFIAYSSLLTNVHCWRKIHSSVSGMPLHFYYMYQDEELSAHLFANAEEKSIDSYQECH